MAASNGIKVTQAGIDARFAADYQYVFNSDWPSLQIAFESLVTVGASQTLPAIPHGLKFVPLTMAWVIQNNISIGRSFGVSGTLYGNQTDVQVTFDDTNIYVTNNGTNTYSVSIKSYNIDITKPVDYTLPAPPTIKRTYDPTYGIKVVKYGKSVGSKDLRDFILHSRAQSPALLSVVTEKNAYVSQPTGAYYLYSLVYSNPVNYMPWTLAFVGTNGVYTGIAPGTQQSGPIFDLTTAVEQYLTQQPKASNKKGPGAVVTYQDTAGPTITTLSASIVVLRDPLVVPNTIRVVY